MTKTITTSATPNAKTRAFVFPLAGTVDAEAESTTLTGTGTAFTTFLNAGDDIWIGAVKKRVVTINSATELVVDSAFVDAVVGASVTFFPQEFRRVGNRIVSYRGRKANTGNVYIGESHNAAGDGSDISATTRSDEIVSGGGSVGPVVVNNLYNVFIVSSVASQVIAANVNT